MRLDKLIKIFIIFSIFALTISIDLYLKLKDGKNCEIVVVDLKIKNREVFDNIKAYRISPRGFSSLLVRDVIYNSFYSKNGEYLKNVKLVLSEEYINGLETVTVRLGRKEYVYENDNLLKSWSVKKVGDIFELVSPSNIKLYSSIIPNLNAVMNWSGDTDFFLSTTIFYGVLFTIFIILFYLVFSYVEKLSEKNKLKGDMNFGEKLYFLYNNNNSFKIFYIFSYLIVIFFIIVIALIQRFTISSIPYGGNDTWSYIGTAVTTFDKGAFVRTGDRNFFYPFFVFIVLSIFKDFAYLSIVQHVLGIIAGIILLFIWKRIASYFGFYKKNIFFSDFISLILLSLFLFSESVIVYEHTIRPEGIYQFFLILQILFLIEVVIALRENKRLLFYIFITLFFTNNYALFLLQPRWGFNLLFNIIIFLILIAVFNDKIFKKVTFAFILPIMLSFLILYLPQNIITKNEDAISTFLSAKLFFTHVKIIDKELEKDVSDQNFSKYDKEILKRLLEYHQEEYKKPQLKHKYLGFMHNNLIYGPDCASNYLLSKLGEKEYNKFTRYYFFRAVLKHPFDYIKKVLLEMSQFYNFYGGMYPATRYKYDPDAYSEEKITNLDIKNYMYRSYQNVRYNLEKSYYDFKELEIVPSKIFYFFLGRIYLITLFVFFVLLLKKLIDATRNKLFKKYTIYGIVIMILIFYNFFINLTNATTYCLDVNRYIDDQFIVLLASHIMAVHFIVLSMSELNFLKKRSKEVT